MLNNDPKTQNQDYEYCTVHTYKISEMAHEQKVPSKVAYHGSPKIIQNAYCLLHWNYVTRNIINITIEITRKVSLLKDLRNTIFLVCCRKEYRLTSHIILSRVVVCVYIISIMMISLKQALVEYFLPQSLQKNLLPFVSSKSLRLWVYPALIAKRLGRIDQTSRLIHTVDKSFLSSPTSSSPARCHQRS